MKKVLFVILFLLIPIKTFAVVPTVCVPAIIGHTCDRHMFRWKITCTGGFLAYDEDILGLMWNDFKQEVMRSGLMIMDIESSDVNDNFDISFKNAEGFTVFSKTNIPKNVDVTGIDLSEDWNQYLPAHEFMYLTISDDIGFGIIIFYIEGWIPEGR